MNNMVFSTPTRISELSSIIQLNVGIIDTYFDSEGLASPSFDLDYPLDLPDTISQARTSVLEATDELSDLMLGPRQIAECHPPQVYFNLEIFCPILTIQLAYLIDWNPSRHSVEYRRSSGRGRRDNI